MIKIFNIFTKKIDFINKSRYLSDINILFTKVNYILDYLQLES